MIAVPHKSHLSLFLASPECTPLTRSAELVFLQRARQGDRRAVDRLVMANMKFVASVARKYQNQGLSMEDLIQEGAMGLQKGIQKFDLSSPNRLISYAVWWIRQRILMALSQQTRGQNIPPRFFELAARMERARKKVEQAKGRPAALDEVAKEMKLPIEKLQEAQAVLQPLESLDFQVNEGATKIELTEGPSETDRRYEDDQTRRNLETLLKRLEPIDREILRCHYGLKTGECETMAQLAERLGLSRERVRQRQEKALEKILKQAEKMDLFTRSTRPIKGSRRAAPAGA